MRIFYVFSWVLKCISKKNLRVFLGCVWRFQKKVFHKCFKANQVILSWLRNFSKFFKLLFGKKSVLHESVSRQIKSFWVNWTPLRKIINFEPFTSPEIFFKCFLKKKRIFDDSVSRQIKSFWVDSAPLWKL